MLNKSLKPKLPESPMGCPMDRLLRLLMGQWTSYILWMLCSNGPMRFGELKRGIPGVSSKVLTERLRLLEEARIIYRDHVPTIPPQVTYGLSERGKELVTALDELFKIANRWCEEDGATSEASANQSITSEPTS
jgi:DNA-binding HxlR family transcriptional regulator